MQVDTKAAREFANSSYSYAGEEVRLWVHNLADEVERLRVTLTNESRRVCGSENDCVLQPHCSHAQKCMRPEWDAKA